MRRILSAEFKVLREPDVTKVRKWSPIKLRGCQIARTLYALVRCPNGVNAYELSSWALELPMYIFYLRRDYGLDIETIREPHQINSRQKGSHARYKLVTPVTVGLVQWDRWWKW